MAEPNQSNETTRIKKRWTAGRKKEAVLRLLQGEAIDSLSRELGVDIG